MEIQVWEENTGTEILLFLKPSPVPGKQNSSLFITKWIMLVVTEVTSRATNMNQICPCPAHDVGQNSPRLLLVLSGTFSQYLKNSSCFVQFLLCLVMDYHGFDLTGDLKDHKLKTGPFQLDEFISWLAMIFEHFRFYSFILFIF